ncbi:hypothetical protein [Pseudooceanicola sp. LIPI14-2-Ac024]|uniref:hypothetical protein n=1 Tax=Pseudooceanicola sp. LIPI14-2-Ac024 TaxID=3344875 RepID=UPI0035CF44E3
MDVKASMAALQATHTMINQPGAIARDAPASAAREFEAMFLTQMVDEMMKNVDMGDFGGGPGADQFRFFLSEAFAKEISAQGGAGIAQSVEAALRAYAGGTATSQEANG